MSAGALQQQSISEKEASINDKFDKEFQLKMHKIDEITKEEKSKNN